MTIFVQDLRFALRQLRKAPGFALTAILTLALGIGALTTVATWTNAVLFNPWPQVHDARSLRFVDATVLGSEGYSVHYDQFQSLRHQTKSFSDAAVFTLTTLNLKSPGAQPIAFTAGTVSANYFALLGMQPQLGQFFQADADDRAFGAHDEIILSDGLWRERFAADPAVIGKTASINGHTFTVLGVAPAGFAGIFGGIAEAAWVPLSSLRDLSADTPPDPLARYGLQEAVRLRPGVQDSAAAAELHTLAHNLDLQKNGHSSGWDLNLRDSAHFERGFFYAVGEQLPVLLGASVLLMILVCINIASLLGQHAARRRREIAIRTALGARPVRIASQVLIETSLLALLGALAGWGASTLLSRSLYVLLPDFGMPLVFNLHTDPLILLFVVAIATAVTLVCGMVPVRQSLRVSQQEALHEGGAAVAGGSRNRMGQRILLGLQLGICFVVLVCCGLLTRTALAVFHHDLGFDRTNTLTAMIDLSRAGYNEGRSLAFHAQLLDRLRSAPGVVSATLTTHLPLGDWGSGNTQDFAIPGYVPARDEQMSVVTDFDGPDFFRTMGIPLQQGRDFSMHDNTNAPDVAIVNQAMVQRYWPKANPLGSTVIVNQRPRRIVGIVPNYAYHNPADADPPSPVLYLPLAQGTSGYGYAILAVRSRTTATAVVPQLRQAVRSLDPALPIETVRSLEDVTNQQYQGSRIPAELLGVYAFCSVFVAMMGLYAVMAYSVLERHREFALRMALGSTREGIFALVLRGAISVVLIGLITGGLGSIAAVRLVRSMLFGIAPFDPLSYAVAALLLFLTVFVSGLVPARRASTIQPMQALRTE
ncbi:MAG TPA: ABC transporter permease [Terracidiphilus sp.]|jgi:predicted permease|nr:ABC transporter permease [Terracidiphilus sp.]